MNNGKRPTQGLLYIAFGEKWRAEARRSIASLRKVSDVQVAVVSSSPWMEDPVPDLFIIRKEINGWASKVLHIVDTPFDNTLYIDTDTVLVQDPSPVFGLLAHYDIGVRFYGPQLNEGPDLIFHSQCQGGVILFKSNQATAEVFEILKEKYTLACNNSINVKDFRGINEQRYLAHAIAVSKARPVHLGEFLNFTLFDTVLTYSPPVVIHGRLKHLEKIGAEISNNWDVKTDWQARLWLSNIRGILPRGIRRSDPVLALAIILRRLWNDVRRILFKS